jgi:hypothetical protein
VSKLTLDKVSNYVTLILNRRLREREEELEYEEAKKHNRTVNKASRAELVSHYHMPNIQFVYPIDIYVNVNNNSSTNNNTDNPNALDNSTTLFTQRVVYI